MYGKENGYTKEEQVFNLKCVEDKVPVKEDRSRCPLYAMSCVKITTDSGFSAPSFYASVSKSFLFFCSVGSLTKTCIDK
jgi:hypothetical protein